MIINQHIISTNFNGLLTRCSSINWYKIFDDYKNKNSDKEKHIKRLAWFKMQNEDNQLKELKHSFDLIIKELLRIISQPIEEKAKKNYIDKFCLGFYEKCVKGISILFYIGQNNSQSEEINLYKTFEIIINNEELKKKIDSDDIITKKMCLKLIEQYCEKLKKKLKTVQDESHTDSKKENFITCLKTIEQYKNVMCGDFSHLPNTDQKKHKSPISKSTILKYFLISIFGIIVLYFLINF